MNMLAHTPEPVSPRAQEAMQRFDDHTRAKLTRARNEGYIALGVSVALTVVAVALYKLTVRWPQEEADKVAVVQCFVLASAFVLSVLAVIRSFQSAALPERGRIRDWIDHFSILWLTLFFGWLLNGVAKL